MALNEHKNIVSNQRHNPKGFEDATNDTVLTKTLGTSATESDGELSYKSRNAVGTVDYTIIGYSLTSDHSNSNYHRAAHMTDGQSPNQYNADTGQTAVASISINHSMLITRAANLVVDSNSTVYKVYGWINSSGSNTITLAIAKVTPVANSTSTLNPVVIDEITVTGLGSAQKLIQINETTITNASLTAGDYLIVFIKEAGGVSNIYWQVKICTTKD